MPLAGRNRSLVLATSRYGEGIRVNAHDIEKGGEGENNNQHCRAWGLTF